MRFKLTLTALRTPFLIPYNYQPLLQAAIYQYLAQNDADYASFLHNTGYWKAEDGKHYKMFVFSDLLLGRRIPESEYLKVISPEIHWIISSPMREFLQNLVNGLFRQGYLKIQDSSLIIKFLETLPEPVFSEAMTFKCLSPITVSVRDEKNGRLGEHYVLPSERETFSRVIRENMLHKYQRINGNEPANTQLTFQFDDEYIQRRGGKVSRLVTVHGGTAEETNIRGFFAPFKVQGNPELIKIGYEAGFGGRNSLGFGMAEVVK